MSNKVNKRQGSESVPSAPTDYMVTVCSTCRCASCWHGEFMCGGACDAGTIVVLASVLRWEGREHPSNYSVARLLEVCGPVKGAA